MRRPRRSRTAAARHRTQAWIPPIVGPSATAPKMQTFMITPVSRSRSCPNPSDQGRHCGDQQQARAQTLEDVAGDEHRGADAGRG